MGRGAGSRFSGPWRRSGRAEACWSTPTTRFLDSVALAFLLTTVAILVPAPSGLAASNPRTTDPARPFVTVTDPADGEMGFPLYVPIIVHFSERMNASNTIVRILPTFPLDEVWLSRNQSLLLTLGRDFTPCTTYWVFVDGTDVAGESLLVFADAPVPNPWTFTTACPVFTITRTDPTDGGTNVAVGSSYAYGQAIVVWFSRAADPATLQVTLSPAVPLTPQWSSGNAKVTMHHATWFQDCTPHTVTVSAKDTAGNPLTNATGSAPNPWTFATMCLSPIILGTDPADGATDVALSAPIVVTFSEPMNTMSVGWSVFPDPGFAANWTDGNKTLTLVHAAPFGVSTVYSVTISGQGSDGEGLGAGPVPNPWSFTTAATIPGPTGLRIARTSPHVTLSWNAAPGARSYLVYSATDRFAPWPWTRLDEVTTTSYVHLNADGDGLSHYYVVHTKDWLGVESGNSTMGAKVPLSFDFDIARTNVHWLSLPYRSGYATAKDVSDELTSANIDVVGRWDPASGRSVFWFYFRGAWRGTDFALKPSDAFVIGVLADFTWIVTGTDGRVAHSLVLYGPPSGDVHWVSLPFTSPYARARDVVVDIEGNTGPSANRLIVEVARWDPVGERLVSFAWTPAGWDGTDFGIAVGEGVYVRVVSTFTWTPRLITPEVA